MTEKEIIIYYIGFYHAKYGTEQLKERLAKQANITTELIDEVISTVAKRFG